MQIVYIDSLRVVLTQSLSVLELTNLIARSSSFFCYHPLLTPEGNCRMCLVEIDKNPKPQASCCLPTQNNMKIFTNSPMVLKARENIIEFLLQNHPLDCPVCDQGGECDLQDQSFLHGSFLSRYRKKKKSFFNKTYNNVIKTVMNRCINCTKCVRFSNEILNLVSLGNLNRGKFSEINFFIRSPRFQTEYSSNIVDICPVGNIISNDILNFNFILNHYKKVFINSFQEALYNHYNRRRSYVLIILLYDPVYNGTDLGRKFHLYSFTRPFRIMAYHLSAFDSHLYWLFLCQRLFYPLIASRYIFINNDRKVNIFLHADTDFTLKIESLIQRYARLVCYFLLRMSILTLNAEGAPMGKVAYVRYAQRTLDYLQKPMSLKNRIKYQTLFTANILKNLNHSPLIFTHQLLQRLIASMVIITKYGEKFLTIKKTDMEQKNLKSISIIPQQASLCSQDLVTPHEAICFAIKNEPLYRIEIPYIGDYSKTLDFDLFLKKIFFRDSKHNFNFIKLQTQSEWYYSFNTNSIDMLKIGALTLKPYSYNSRSWEHKYKISIDPLTPFNPSVRYELRKDQLIRILPVYNSFTRDFWISDRFRFIFLEFGNRLNIPQWSEKNSNRSSSFWKKSFNQINFFLHLYNPKDVNLTFDSLFSVFDLCLIKDFELKYNITNVYNNRFIRYFSFQYLNPKMSNFTSAYRLYINIGVNPQAELGSLFIKLQQDCKSLIKIYNFGNSFLNDNVSVIGYNLNLLKNLYYSSLNKINKMFLVNRTQLISFFNKTFYLRNDSYFFYFFLSRFFNNLNTIFPMFFLTSFNFVSSLIFGLKKNRIKKTKFCVASKEPFIAKNNTFFFKNTSDFQIKHHLVTLNNRLQNCKFSVNDKSILLNEIPITFFFENIYVYVDSITGVLKTVTPVIASEQNSQISLTSILKNIFFCSIYTKKNFSFFNLLNKKTNKTLTFSHFNQIDIPFKFNVINHGLLVNLSPNIYNLHIKQDLIQDPNFSLYTNFNNNLILKH